MVKRAIAPPAGAQINNRDGNNRRYRHGRDGCNHILGLYHPKSWAGLADTSVRFYKLVAIGFGNAPMTEEDERGSALPRLPVTHVIGQSLDSLSASEIGERILLLNMEIARLEQARRSKQEAQAAAAAFFKI